MRFEFATAGRIVFGPGSIQGLAEIAAGLGTKPCLVTGGDLSRAEPAASRLLQTGAAPLVLQFPSEPEVGEVARAATTAREAGCDFVVAMGGGSAIDAGKAVAAFAANPGDVLRYLEVIGEGRPLERNPLPCVAIPTTAGTGAEATRNAVLGSPVHRVKVSVRHRAMLPVAAIVDPCLALGLPPALTASTGMDAITQLVEPFLSPHATPFTDALVRQALPPAVRALSLACADGTNLEARQTMAFAALCGGMALANAKLGAVHGLAGPMGGMLPQAPHGAICARLLVPVLRLNASLLKQANSPALRKFDELGLLLSGGEHSTADAAIQALARLEASLPLATLGELGLARELLPELAHKAGKSSSMQGNPVQIPEQTLIAMLEGML